MQTTDSLSLADGLLLGKDDGFSAEFKKLVQFTGVSHIVAASGANLVFLESIFSPLFVFSSHRSKKVFLFLGCLLYFFIAGISGSLWRAGVMWVSTWLGSWFGRKTSLLWLLFQVVLMTVIFFPDFLTSASFWLSWLAMVGLFFSHQVVFCEKSFSYFPYTHRILNYLNKSFFTGWCVFVMVSIWLWTQYQVFQPYGILVTWGIEPFIPLYMVAGLHLRFMERVCLWWVNPICQTWYVLVEQVIDMLFVPIEQWLLFWQKWLVSPLRTHTTSIFLGGLGIFLLVAQLHALFSKSNLVAKWSQ